MQKPLIITTGEPAGIGMDVLLQLSDKGELFKTNYPLIAIASVKALLQRMSDLVAKGSLSAPINIVPIDIEAIASIHENIKHTLRVIDIPTAEPVYVGSISSANAPMVLAQLDLAHQLASSGQVAGIVTAPIQKSNLIPLRPDFMGHTEYFMHLAKVDKVVMMLANERMKVALVTTHLPLRAVPDAITTRAIEQTVDVVLQDFKQKFALSNPRILVCGVNPHAGENGYLGREEVEIINPTLQKYRDKGVNISLAMPADTVFTPHHLSQADVIIAMYHDQGLAPLKSHGFGDTVNITLGLPYIRTSVDHGTALDLAGKGTANPNSLLQAIKTAIKMAVS